MMSRWLFRFAVVALVGAGASGCSSCSKEKAESGFSCVSLQQRAQQCRAETLAIVKAEIDRGKTDSGRDDTEQQYKMFASRFETKLDGEQTRKQCEKFSAAGGPTYAERVAQMKACHAKDGCEAFAKCMLQM